MNSEQELQALEGTLDQCSKMAKTVVKGSSMHSDQFLGKRNFGTQMNYTSIPETDQSQSDCRSQGQCVGCNDHRSQCNGHPSECSGQSALCNDTVDTSCQVSSLGITYRHSPETELSVLVVDCSESGDTQPLQFFLQHLKSVNPTAIDEQDQVGMTALHFAVSCKCYEAVRLLLEHGANVNVEDGLGFTPLFQATGRYPDLRIAHYLLENGKAFVNHTTKTGATPLHGAIFQGNTECVHLLLDYGANPCLEDEDGTNAFELTNDQGLLTVLMDCLTETNARKDTIDAQCCHCGQIPKDGLKRCGRCHVTWYCSKECQRKHWTLGGHRSNCPGFVVARPFCKAEEAGECLQVSFYKVMGSSKSQVKVYERNALESISKSDFLRERRFIVKAQLPIGPSTGEIMVYNIDRSVQGFIYPEEHGYGLMYRMIQLEGYRQIKAFFWAELCESFDGKFKVFHGKTAPYQQW